MATFIATNQREATPMTKFSISLVAWLLAISTLSHAETIDKGQVLSGVAAHLPRGIAGIPDQWFEMKSAIGWEKMALFIGYADNKSACELLVGIAAQQAPDREFRCTDAN
jgi:hypothetical protein